MDGARADAATQNTSAGTVLTKKQTGNLLNTVKSNLDEKSFPSQWVDDLKKEDFKIKFYTKKKLAAVGKWWPAWNHLGLQAGMSLKSLTLGQLDTITHELFHAWFDMVLTWPIDDLSGLNEAQEEVCAWFIGATAGEQGLSNSLSESLGAARSEKYGGSKQDFFKGLKELKKTWPNIFNRGFRQGNRIKLFYISTG